jgi:DNA-directed RNA polymerase subunit E'/Rpb7
MSHGPYFTTRLEADINVHPSQMNNNIVDNIRKNLIAKLSGNSYRNHGIIVKVIEIDPDVKGGILRAEDPTASSLHRVKFKCRLCNPLKQSVIMGRIVTINNKIIVAEEGPIKFLIGESEINAKNITFRNSAFYPLSSKGDIINKQINQGTYVMIKVMGKKIVKQRILVFGRLESVVPDDMVKKYITNRYEDTEMIEDANELIKRDEAIKENEDIMYTEETEVSNDKDTDDGNE